MSVFDLQARHDILAQDLAEAIDSQVELADQLRCYREDNEKLLAEKQTVCVCVGERSVMTHYYHCANLANAP